jgi:branched-chain amino acid transport system substrate-binding protein
MTTTPPGTYHSSTGAGSFVQAYCTNPECPSADNSIPSNVINTGTQQQRYCSGCGMELILQLRYLPIKPIGNGGFGQTFLTQDLSFSNQLCVLKQLRPRIPLQPAQLENVQKLFNDEAEILRRLKHTQIPSVSDRFSLPLPGNSDSKQRLFYLVQEYVPGKDNHLPENLLQELNRKKLNRSGVFSEAQIREVLKSLLEVLNYLHKKANNGKGLIHRDIKPENIIRDGQDDSLHLIDFGTVKLRFEPGVPASQSIVIGTPGYAPPEQLSGGEIDDTADLYALAATCVHLLTGEEPQKFITGWNFDPRWREQATIHDSLFQILSQMLRSQPQERYPSAQSVLNALEQTNSQPSPTVAPVQTNVQVNEQASPSHPPTQVTTLPSPTPQPPTAPTILHPRRRFPRWAIAPILALIACLLAIGFHLWQTQAPSQDPRFSLGEKLLIEQENTLAKQKGIEAFAKKDYQTAVNQFQASLDQQRNDPESLIYLNNAQVNGQAYRIAVSVPIGSNLNVAQEILRGVAQAQDEINQASDRITDNIGLQVQIINDNNDPKIAAQVANALVKDSDILAVVGHNASDASLAAAPIYQAGGLTMISPTSFASDLTRSDKTYIFRAVQTPRFMADVLARYATETAKKNIILSCFDSKAFDNRSFKDEFIASLLSLGGKAVPMPCDFADNKFDSNAVMVRAIAAGADGLLLAPHIDRLDRAIALAQVNQGRISLFSSASLYTFKILEEGGAAFDGLVLPVPWHPDAYPNNAFSANAVRLWGGKVTWRTAGAYDATRAIITALQQKNSRENIQQVLRTPGFAATGTREIQFLPTGDREGNPVLVRVEPDPSQPSGYNFALLNP